MTIDRSYAGYPNAAPVIPTDPITGLPDPTGSATAPLSVAGAASSNYAPSQVSVAATATSLIAARSGGRNAVVITNMSTTPVFLGGSGVTAATGGYLAGVVGAAKVLPYNGAIYGITATGTASVSVEEIY
jgi:outer membrane receptor for ferric coprogen and ferric-rhodotorulic acid